MVPDSTNPKIKVAELQPERLDSPPDDRASRTDAVPLADEARRVVAASVTRALRSRSA